MSMRRGLGGRGRWDGSSWSDAQWAGWLRGPTDTWDRIGLGNKRHGAGVWTDTPHLTGPTVQESRGGQITGAWGTVGVVRSGRLIVGARELVKVGEGRLVVEAEVGEGEGCGCGGAWDVGIDIISVWNDCRIFRLIGLGRLV